MMYGTEFQWCQDGQDLSKQLGQAEQRHLEGCQKDILLHVE